MASAAHSVWLLLHLLRLHLSGGPGVVHHLLDLGLLLREPRDVRLEVLQGVVHVLQVARVAVHVAAAVGGRLPGGLVVAQPPVLNGGKVVGHVLQWWKESNQGVVLCKSTVPCFNNFKFKDMQRCFCLCSGI